MAEIGGALRRLDPRALNSLKSGAYSRAVLLPDEDPEERRRLQVAYEDHFQPVTMPEIDAVRELVDLSWRRMRLARAEAAMVAGAIAKAANDAPEPIVDLAQEVSAMQVEVGLLNKLLTRLQGEINDKSGDPKAFVIGIAPVLDRLLNWKTTVADMAPNQVLADGAHTLHARIASMEASRATLKRLLDVTKVSRDAAVAAASLLDAKQGARMAQERTTLSRAIERQIRILRGLRGGTQFEAHIRMSEDVAKVFHEANFGDLYDRQSGEVAA